MIPKEHLTKVKSLKHEIQAKATLTDSLKKTLSSAELEDNTEFKALIISLQEDIRQLFNMMETAIAVINEIDNELHKAFLFYYYLDNFTLLECSQALYVSLRTVKRYKDKALLSFEKVYNNEQ